jgi:dephospho-CoA kinase
VKVIGIVGGIASGKSAVSGFCEALDATVLNADRIAHEMLQRPAVVKQLVGRWGSDVVDSENAPRRGEIAKRVFGRDGESELAWLESLIHPLVHQELKLALAHARQSNTELVVLDVPLLLERGWDKDCDQVLFVDAPLAMRRERAAQRGWAPDELERRESRQWPIDKKRAAADSIVDNRGDLESLHQSLRKIIQPD